MTPKYYEVGYTLFCFALLDSPNFMNTSQTPYGAQLNIYKKNHISNVLINQNLQHEYIHRKIKHVTHYLTYDTWKGRFGRAYLGLSHNIWKSLQS